MYQKIRFRPPFLWIKKLLVFVLFPVWFFNTILIFMFFEPSINQDGGVISGDLSEQKNTAIGIFILFILLTFYLNSRFLYRRVKMKIRDIETLNIFIEKNKGLKLYSVLNMDDLELGVTNYYDLLLLQKKINKEIVSIRMDSLKSRVRAIWRAIRGVR